MDVRRAVAALLLLGLLVGCSEDEPGADPPEPTISASTSPTPSETGGDAHSPEEAVRHWFAALNQAFASGDTTELQNASATGCLSCQGYVEAIDRTTAAGGSFSAPAWTITRMRMIKDTKAAAVLHVTVHEPAGSTIRRAGDEPTPFPAVDDRFRVSLSRADGAWIVTTLGILN